MNSALYPDTVLVNRYAITEVVNVDDTVEIYRAVDHTLQRTVIVKALAPALAAHDETRRTFRELVVRTAALDHPHLAKVYDGAQQQGRIFMVTENLVGGSLEDILRTGRIFSADETAQLGRDVASVLHYLHTQGVVHGGLTPSHIMFDEFGRLRVTDVALASLRSFHPPSRAFQRYLSPEELLGLAPTPASDVYALAVILYEMATGTSPFDGHTTEAAITARTAMPLPSRPELGALDIVLAQATIPDPLMRSTSEELADRLAGLTFTIDPFVHLVEAAPSLLGNIVLPEPRAGVGFRPPSTEEIVSGASRPAPSPPAAVASSSSPTPLTGPRRRWYVAAALVVILVAVGGGALWKSGLLTTKHTVPSLAGLSLTQAEQVVKSDNFTINVGQRQSSATVPLGNVISQQPAAGQSLASGSTLTLILSNGPSHVNVPLRLVGGTCAADTRKLQTLGLNATCPGTLTSAATSVPAGFIAQVRYHGEVNPIAVPEGATLNLVTSTRPAATTTTISTSTTTTVVSGTGPRPVPNLVGMNDNQVWNSLHNAALYFQTVGPGAGTTLWTRVVSQSPAAGTMVPWHSLVTLHVTK